MTHRLFAKSGKSSCAFAKQPNRIIVSLALLRCCQHRNIALLALLECHPRRNIALLALLQCRLRRNIALLALLESNLAAISHYLRFCESCFVTSWFFYTNGNPCSLLMDDVLDDVELFGAERLGIEHAEVVLELGDAADTDDDGSDFGTTQAPGEGHVG